MARRAQLCASYCRFCHPSRGERDGDGEGSVDDDASSVLSLTSSRRPVVPLSSHRRDVHRRRARAPILEVIGRGEGGCGRRRGCFKSDVVVARAVSGYSRCGGGSSLVCLGRTIDWGLVSAFCGVRGMLRRPHLHEILEAGGALV